MTGHGINKGLLINRAAILPLQGTPLVARGDGESWLLFELKGTSPCPSSAERTSLTGVREIIMSMLIGNLGEKTSSLLILAAFYRLQLRDELCVPGQNIPFQKKKSIHFYEEKKKKRKKKNQYFQIFL